ncbi:uncharacterized protein HMPREF1541_10297 [Cyphellophora europaea CBS 101466]|uniref:Peptidase A1 domain-containing protein n=1 Tax=Cyphellophora europaea (strain CBS 101466) TaxID=1220924 RepID=W2S7G5_CYPE1|nr:uncharacterized protein HMPREF1541_10297 [Cyphellophora europaea CBS 101466]ETN44627.1 hypothetical protein HMPREF1541_10297 [Cyphellophora europaea CBS 101466]
MLTLSPLLALCALVFAVVQIREASPFLPPTPTDPNLQETFPLSARFYPYPYPPLNTSTAPAPAQTYILSSSMTVDLTSLLPDSLSHGVSMPLVLDTMQACTWVPTRGMSCHTYDGNGGTGTGAEGDGDANSVARGGGGVNCSQISAVDPPLRALFGQVNNGLGAETYMERKIALLAPRTACTHWLGGYVVGDVVPTALRFAGKEIGGSEVLFADEFYAAEGRSFLDFQRYYGGGSGVLGLGMYEDLYAVQKEGKGLEVGGRMVSGLLRTLWMQDDASERGLVARMFSISLPRRNESGKFVVGGAVDDERGLESVDAQRVSVSLPRGEERELVGLLHKMLYAVPGVGLSVGGTSADRSKYGDEYFLESALPVVYTTRELAEGVAAVFEPPGSLNVSSRVYEVSCGAVAPGNISFKISTGQGDGSVSFPIYPDDLIVPIRLDDTGACMSAFQVDWLNPDMRRLGWPFFRNVIASIDVGKWTIDIRGKAWPNSRQQSSSTFASPNISSSPSGPGAAMSFEVSKSLISSITSSPASQPPASDPLGISFTSTAHGTGSSPTGSKSITGGDNIANAPESLPLVSSPPPGSMHGALTLATSTAQVATPSPVPETSPSTKRARALDVVDEQSGATKWADGEGRGHRWPRRFRLGEKWTLWDSAAKQRTAQQRVRRDTGEHSKGQEL